VNSPLFSSDATDEIDGDPQNHYHQHFQHPYLSIARFSIFIAPVVNMGADKEAPPAPNGTKRRRNGSPPPSLNGENEYIASKPYYIYYKNGKAIPIYPTIAGTGLMHPGPIEPTPMLGTPPKAESKPLVGRKTPPHLWNPPPHQNTQKKNKQTRPANGNGTAPPVQHPKPGPGLSSPGGVGKSLVLDPLAYPYCRPPTPPKKPSILLYSELSTGDRILEVPEVTDGPTMCLDRATILLSHSGNAEKLPNLTGFGHAIVDWVADSSASVEALEAHRLWIWGKEPVKFPFEEASPQLDDKDISSEVTRCRQLQTIEPPPHMSTNDGINLMKLLWRRSRVSYCHFHRLALKGTFLEPFQLIDTISWLDCEKRRCDVGDYNPEDVDVLVDLRAKGHVLRRMISVFDYHIACIKEAFEEPPSELLLTRKFVHTLLEPIINQWKEHIKGNKRQRTGEVTRSD
jgi:hypothetical protein